MLKFIGLLMLVGIVMAVARGVGEHRQAQREEVVKPSAPVAKVTANELVRAYVANEVAADQKYKDQVFQITGSVKSISKDLADRPVVELHSPDLLRNVSVHFIGQESDIAQLKQEDDIVLRGRVDGLMMDVQVKDAVIERWTTH